MINDIVLRSLKESKILIVVETLDKASDFKGQ